MHGPTATLPIHGPPVDLTTPMRDSPVAATSAPMSGLFCYNASLLFTLAICVDRYMKVEHGLRYHMLATNRRLILAMAAVWFISLTSSFIPYAVVSQRMYRVLLTETLAAVTAGLLITVSTWVKVVRNRHLVAIEKRNRHFGVHGEQLNAGDGAVERTYWIGSHSKKCGRHLALLSRSG